MRISMWWGGVIRYHPLDIGECAVDKFASQDESGPLEFENGVDDFVAVADGENLDVGVGEVLGNHANCFAWDDVVEGGFVFIRCVPAQRQAVAVGGGHASAVGRGRPVDAIQVIACLLCGDAAGHFFSASAK